MSDIYKKAAQKLIEYDDTLAAEWNNSDPEAVYTARRLYEEHGPFELSWSGYKRGRGESPEWYDYE